MSKIFKPRRGTTYTMRSTNKKSTVLAKGEMFLEVPNTGVGTGASKIIIGDGVTTFENLPIALSGTTTSDVTTDSSTTVSAALNKVVSGKEMADLFGSLKKAISLNQSSISAINDKLPFSLAISSGVYGYKNTSGTFQAFKSQADIDSAIAAARVGTATAAQVLTGYTFTNSTSSGLSGSMANRGKVTQTLNCGSSYTIPAGYHNGQGTVTANSLSGQTGVDSGTNATAATVVSGKQCWVNGTKIVGTFAAQEKSATPGASAVTVTPDSGKYLTKVTVSAVSLSGDATAGNVLTGKTFYNNSLTKVTGTMTNQGTKTQTLSAGTLSYTIPAGYHSGSGTVSISKSNTYKSTATGTNINASGWAATLNCGQSVTVGAGAIYAGSVTANSLASQTGVDSGKTAVTAAKMVSGYQGWVNGTKITGTFAGQEKSATPGASAVTVTPDSGKYLTKVTVSAVSLSGDATAGNVLTGKTFYNNSLTKVTGTMANNGTITTQTLNPGGSYTIPAGYHSGSGKVQAASPSGTFTIASSNSGFPNSNIDMGSTNNFRYVNAAAVYVKGKDDGVTDVTAALYLGQMTENTGTVYSISVAKSVSDGIWASDSKDTGNLTTDFPLYVKDSSGNMTNILNNIIMVQKGSYHLNYSVGNESADYNVSFSLATDTGVSIGSATAKGTYTYNLFGVGNLTGSQKIVLSYRGRCSCNMGGDSIDYAGVSASCSLEYTLQYVKIR